MDYDQAIKLLEDNAAYYELANNCATQSKRYHKEDSPYWEIAQLLRNMWRPISTAPIDGTYIVLYHRVHGEIEGHFYAGTWTTTIDGDDCDGPMWVLGDDIAQEEIEDCGEHGLRHGQITHWKPRSKPPEFCPRCKSNPIDRAFAGYAWRRTHLW